MVDPHISVVIPVYGCHACLHELHERLHVSLSRISENYEIFMVNDASPDDSWQIIQTLARKFKRVKGISLSRNFGQHHAITAGLDFVRGDWVVVMDCDLQDQPEEILKLYDKAQLGFDIVVGRRALRKDSALKRLSSRMFYFALNYFTDAKLNNRIGNFGIYARRVIQSICGLKEQNRSFGLFAFWVGFRRVEIDIEHAARPYGESGYTFKKMLNLATDSILAHSTKLLWASIKLGFLLASSALLYSLWLVIRYFAWAVPVAGWTSLMVSIYFTAGLILGSVGVLGIYLGKIFEEVKRRPLYIIESTTFEAVSHAD